MQFIDLAAQQKRIKNKIDENIQKVLNHGKYIMGPEVGELENRLAEYTGVKHAISCSSGTDALLLALMAYGVGPGDAVFVPAFTFFATAEVVSLLGGTPVFVDIDPVTFNMDTDKLEKAIEALKQNDPSIHPLPAVTSKSQPSTLRSKSTAPVLRSRTTAEDGEDGQTSNVLTPRGIIPVDLFGLPADYDRIDVIARKHGLFVIEDAAQSFGAEYKERKACSLADIACTSFFPAKPLGCYGDGGMCFTDNDDLAETMKSLRVHGKGSHKYDNARIGINGRIDTLQAAILLTKFDIFPEEVELRNQAANRYNDLLASMTSNQSPGVSITLPQIPSGLKSVWAQYSILTSDSDHRDRLQERLKERGIPTAIYYPKPLHFQTVFSSFGYKEGDLPVCEDFSHRIFSIPMHPYLKEDDQSFIAQAICGCN